MTVAGDGAAQADGAGKDLGMQPLPTERVPTSGQSYRQKIQFSAAIISPLACGTVLSFSKDIYILELGADAPLMGVVSTVVAGWGLFCLPLVGYLMDRDLLTRYFPWATWGRRAPWFLTNLFLAAVATALMYMPPSLDPGFLGAWYLAMAMVQGFALTVLFTAFLASRVEIYPTKEERTEGEFFVKLAAGLGNTLGLVPQLLIAAGATLLARALVSGLYLMVGIVSIVAIPILRMARQEYDASQVSTPWREAISLLRIPTYRHYLASRLVEAFAVSTVLSSMIYYITVVEGFSGEKRSFFILAIGAIIAVVTLAVMIPWAQFFRRRRRGVNSNAVAGFVNGLGLLAPVVLLLGDALLPAPAGVLGYIMVEQATWTGQTFWRLAAIGWLVDEDALAVAKRRREAVFSAGTLFVTAVGQALAGLMVLNGLAAAGLNMENCEQTCDGSADDGCVAACQAANIARQPAAVTTYLRIMLCAVVPAFQLTCAVLTFTFPIKGDRLEAIYSGQAAVFKPCSLVVGATATEAPPPDAKVGDPPAAAADAPSEVPSERAVVACVCAGA